ncbi:MAG: hypothetical protein AAGF12_18900 [Myxococcota bacterium]
MASDAQEKKPEPGGERSPRQALKALAALAIVLLAAGIGGYIWAMPRRVTPRAVDWSSAAAPATDAVRVYWVGHSLMNHRDTTVPDAANLIEAVGELAESASLSYTSFDHTVFGAPLSLNWTGAVHSYDRTEPDQAQKLKELLERGENYDALVLTEAIPVRNTARFEHSAYYAQQFYCAMLRKNPEARIYLYESWPHLNASDPDAGYPEAHRFDWTAQVQTDRADWERLADEAMTGRVSAPSFLSRLFRRSESGCEPGGPILMVPVGTAMAALRAAIEERPADWFFADGRPLRFVHLFQNPLEGWPEHWPGSEDPDALSAIPLLHPDDPADDIHPSEVGTYFAALVHFATLYRRNPRGAVHPISLSAETARHLQDLAWDVVREDPRTGVSR